MVSPSQAVAGQPVVDGVGRIPGWVNCYTFRDGPDLYLIDTGFSRRAGGVLKAFRQADLSISNVGQIVLTHHHVDHMGGAAFLLQSTPAPLECHADDAPYVDGRVKPPMPLLMRLLVRTHPAPVKVQLKEGDQVGPLRVIHSPGHTPGEIMLYHHGRKILFSGDTAVESKGRLILPAAGFAWNMEAAVRSLEKIRALDVEVLLPGHGVPVTKNVPSMVQALIDRAPSDYLHKGKA